MPQIDRQEPPRDPQLHRRASRAKAALLSRASPQRRRGHSRAICVARQRSDQPGHPVLEAGAHDWSRDPRAFRRLRIDISPGPKRAEWLPRMVIALSASKERPIGGYADFLEERKQCT